MSFFQAAPQGFLHTRATLTLESLLTIQGEMAEGIRNVQSEEGDLKDPESFFTWSFLGHHIMHPFYKLFLIT